MKIGWQPLRPPFAGRRPTSEARPRSSFDIDYRDSTARTSHSKLADLRASFVAEDKSPHEKHRHGKTSNPGDSKKEAGLEPFDICPIKVAGVVVLKPSLLAQSREKRNETNRGAQQPSASFLRPGMVLLKRYLTSSDQVKIVKVCRDLGMGCGGFYKPGYKNGAQLNLKMMCLGKNWDPETHTYGDQRPLDAAHPPPIPEELHQLASQAVRDAHAHLQKQDKSAICQHVLPSMSPDVCIVNFYSQSGRLGLHQDNDESADSLLRGLPVVSFSIGDSAEFLFGDGRDEEKAALVKLESGDVLLFGGESRHVFHGVKSVLPDTAPSFLRDRSNLRPGRLNLTFRQY